MTQNLSHISFENACADIFCFDNGTEVKEYQVMIHVSQHKLPYAQQLEAVMNSIPRWSGIRRFFPTRPTPTRRWS